MECDILSVNDGQDCDQNHHQKSSREREISAILSQQPKDTSYKDEWRKEVDKLYKRPNVKLQKAQSLLTASLKNNGPPDGFSKYLAEYKKKQKAPLRSVTSRVNVRLPITDGASRHVDRGRSNTLLASTLASMGTTRAFNPKSTLDSSNRTRNRFTTAVSCEKASNSAYYKTHNSSSEHKTITGIKWNIRDTEREKHESETVTLASVCTQDGSIQEEPQKSNTKPRGTDGFGRKHFPCMRSSSNKLLNVYSIDDGIRPQTITKVAANPTTTVKCFQRPCGINSRDDRPLSRGNVPIHNCIERAFFVAVNSKTSIPAVENSSVRKSNNELKKQRPQSAPASSYYKFLNKNLHEHMNDTIIAKGKIKLLYPKDKARVITLLKEGLYQADIDMKLDDLYNKCLQERLKSACS